MSKQIIPFIKTMKAMIYAGQSDDYIHHWLFENSLPIKNSEIDLVRQECCSTLDGSEMVHENTVRLENNEGPLILESISAKSRYPDLFKILIIDFSNNTPPMQRGRLLDFAPAKILNDAKLRKLVENVSMTYSDFQIVEQLAADLKIEFVDEGVYEGYLEYLWDVNSFDQHQLAKYLYENRDHPQYGPYINPVRDGIENIRHSFGLIEPGELIREINYHNYQLQNKLKRNLMYGEEPNSRDVANFRSSQNNLNRLGAYNIVSEVETEQDRRYSCLMRGDDTPRTHQHNIFITPHKNSIRLMSYMGLSSENISDILRRDKFNDIPDCFMDNIFKECRSIPEGEKMISDNQKNQLEHKALVNSPIVRDKFKDKEIYDKAFKLSSKIEKLSDLMSEDILDNEEKRRLLDCCIMAGTSYKRVKEAWKQLFNKLLTEKEYNSYKYYIWDLGYDFEMGLYQYLEQDPDSQLYKDYKYLLGKDPLNVMDYFGLTNDEEIKEIDMRMWGQLNHILEDALQCCDSTLAALLQKELTRLGKIFREGDDEHGKEYYRFQLGRLFARIVPDNSPRLTLDQLNNRCNRSVPLPEIDEEKK